jgi:transcriptional regulator with XRE-family HTH domain
VGLRIAKWKDNGFTFSDMPKIDPEIKGVGDRIKVARQRRDWSQERLADESKLHRTYVSGIERGIRNPSLKNIFRIAKALRVRAAEFFE